MRSYFVLRTIVAAGVRGILATTVPCRSKTQDAPDGLVLTVISWLVPSKTVAQPAIAMTATIVISVFRIASLPFWEKLTRSFGQVELMPTQRLGARCQRPACAFDLSREQCHRGGAFGIVKVDAGHISGIADH